MGARGAVEWRRWTAGGGVWWWCRAACARCAVDRGLTSCAHVCLVVGFEEVPACDRARFRQLAHHVELARQARRAPATVDSLCKFEGEGWKGRLYTYSEFPNETDSDSSWRCRGRSDTRPPTHPLISQGCRSAVFTRGGVTRNILAAPGMRRRSQPTAPSAACL